MLRFHYAQFERHPPRPNPRIRPCHAPYPLASLYVRYAQSPTILLLVNLPLMPQRNAKGNENFDWISLAIAISLPHKLYFLGCCHWTELTCKLGGQWSSSSSICLIFCASCITKFNSMSNSPPTNCKKECEIKEKMIKKGKLAIGRHCGILYMLIIFVILILL